MNYSVVWSPNATSALAAIWIRAPNRQVVTDAEVRISRLLGIDPFGNGIPVSEGLYAIQAHPLRAVFEIYPAQRAVWVVSVNMLI